MPRVKSRRLVPALIAALGAAGCQPKPPAAPVAPASNLRFTDVTEMAGIRFRHTHGGSGKKLMPETVGSGCAWLDYDGDGWQDLLLVNCTALPGTPKDPAQTARLYRNHGDGTFEDRTAGSGLDVPLYGQGVTAADYDGDGDPDLLLTCVGPNRLFRNDGAGRFTNVSAASGLAEGGEPWRWHAGATWLDYDRDGKLDVLIARYVKWTPATDRFCGVPGGVKRYCPPVKYAGESLALYHNEGGGKFRSVSQELGLGKLTGKWFQPLVLDENRDGWPDVAVTSDGTPAALLRNDHGRRFIDVAAEQGLGLSETGAPKSGMGIDAADWRNLGQEAVAIGNFSGDKLSLFEPDASGLYSDMVDQVGMGQTSLYALTFGLAFLDVDRDGWPDAFIGNGHIDDYIERFEANVTYAQRPLLFHNLHGERFQEVGLQAGPALAQKLVVRGLAVADYDQDGDPDVLVLENNRTAHLFRNDTPGGSWLRVKLRGQGANRDAIGALVELTAGGTTQQRMVRAGGSFLSQSELPVLFGLGSAQQGRLKVRWPDGHTREQDVPAVNQVVEITE